MLEAEVKREPKKFFDAHKLLEEKGREDRLSARTGQTPSDEDPK